MSEWVRRDIKLHDSNDSICHSAGVSILSIISHVVADLVSHGDSYDAWTIYAEELADGGIYVVLVFKNVVHIRKFIRLLQKCVGSFMGQDVYRLAYLVV